MVHETIHAYDHCRAKVNWSSCHHHACSEIRAANLSGDCRIVNELARGNLFGGIKEQHQVCLTLNWGFYRFLVRSALREGHC